MHSANTFDSNSEGSNTPFWFTHRQRYKYIQAQTQQVTKIIFFQLKMLIVLYISIKALAR